MAPFAWRFAERQIARHLPYEHVAPALGDLLEDYAKHEVAVGRLRASWWLFREVRSLTLAYRRRPFLPLAASEGQMSWIYDFRSAFKSLRSSRGTALAAIVTLALGTGANTAVLAVAYGVLLRPLPFAAPDRLVVIDTVRRPSGTRLGVKLAEIEEWRRRLPGVDGLAAFGIADLTVRGVGEPDSVRSLLVTGDFFRVLGTPPAAGQPFSDSRAAVIVLGDRYARRVGSVKKVLGRAVTIGQAGFQIGAVMPPAFAFPDDQVDMWVPAESIGSLNVFGNAGDARSYRLVARRRPGVTVDGLRQEAERARNDIRPEAGAVATVQPLLETVAGDARPMLAAFVAAAVLLLLVACANVATLFVGRGVARRREFAVRLALGASPMRLVRGALAESVILAAAGSALGVVLAEICLRLFIHAASSSLPRVSAVTIDVPVLTAAAAVALLVTILSGLAPALSAAKTDFAPAFRETVSSPGASRARGPLVVLQVAMAIVLLTGAGLLARTVAGLLRGHGGVEADHVLTSRLMLSEGTRFDARGRLPFIRTLLERVRALPGVTAAGVGSDLPPRHNQLEVSIRLIDETTHRDESLAMDLISVTPGYLETLGIRLEAGRRFAERDAMSGTPVAILSEHAARDLSPKRSPIDRPFIVALPTPAGPRVRPSVVGVVSDVHYTGLDAVADDNVYALWQNMPTGTSYLVARTTGDPRTLATMLVETVRELDPGLPLLDVRSLDDEMNLAIAGRELRLWLVAAFAGLAFAVALVGLSVTLARSVIEQRRELAIRSALGATPQDVMALVGSHGIVLVAAGLAIGLGAAAASGRWVASLLSGVSPYDPTTYAAVMAIVLPSAAIACYVPARRASKVDSLELLRTE
jgi:putative ABC transport system permease protein